MRITELIKEIDKFAPIETQEAWDNCGLQIFYGDLNVKRVMLAVTPNLNVINQAKEKNCDLIVAHHPMFFIPFDCNKNMPVISFHTCLDKADGGTTDTLINELGFNFPQAQKIGDFLRLIKLEKPIELKKLINLVKEKLNLKTFRFVNNFEVKEAKNIAFCAGSGADFIDLARENNADVLITGDIKYHTAADSGIILFDIGHFESERPVLFTLKKILETMGIEVILADEKSPFINC